MLGLDIRGDAERLRSLVGYMPENDSFIARMPGIRFVRYMAELSGIIEEVKPRRITVYWCDSKIHQVDEVEDVFEVLEAPAAARRFSNICASASSLSPAALYCGMFSPLTPVKRSPV